MTGKNNDSSSGTKLFLTNLLSQYGLQLAKYIIPLLTLPYLARVLSLDGYGIRSYVLSAMTLMSVILEFGFMQSATKKIAENREDKRQAGLITGAVLEAKVILIMLAGVFLCILTLAIPLLNENKLYVAISYVAISLNSLLPDFVFMGYETMGILTSRYVVSKGIGLILTFALVHSESDLLLVPLIDVGTSVIALIQTYFGLKRITGVRISFPCIGAGVQELKESAAYFVSNFSSTLFNSYTTMAIGIFFKNPADVALWSLSMTVVSTIQALYSPIYNSLYAYMVARKRLLLFKRVVHAGLIGATTLSVLVVVFSELLMRILGGEGYAHGSYLISVMAPVIWLSFFSLVFGWPLLGAFGFTKHVTYTTIASGILSVFAITAVGLSGYGTLATMAVVRCLTEALLCCSRVGIAYVKRGDMVRMSAACKSAGED